MTYIVQVTESVHVKDVGETGSDKEVLKETGEHVPWVTLCSASER